MDCGGGGSIEFRIGDIERGTYSIRLGDTQLGIIEVPPRPALRGTLEFSTEATATPLPPPAPTPTPTNPVDYPPPTPFVTSTPYVYP